MWVRKRWSIYGQNNKKRDEKMKPRESCRRKRTAEWGKPWSFKWKERVTQMAIDKRVGFKFQENEHGETRNTIW